MPKKHEYRNEIHERVSTGCHLGHELHLMTTNAYGSRVLNLRLFRIVPSQTGHEGYTRSGFFLKREEAMRLRDALNELLEDENAWVEDPEDGFSVMEENDG